MRHASCTGSTFTPDLALQRHGRLRGADRVQLLALRLRRERLQDHLHRWTPTASRRSPARARRRTGAARSSRTALACTAGNQCISGNCVDGVCCGSADLRHLPGLQRHGAGHVHAARGRHDRADAASAPPAPPCGNTGNVQRRRRLPAGLDQHRPCGPAVSCTGDDLPAGVVLLGQRHAAPSRRPRAAATTSAAATPAGPAAPPTRTARAPASTAPATRPRRKLRRQEGERRDLRRRQRVRQRQLRRRRLLPTSSCPTCQACNVTGAGHLRATSRPARPIRTASCAGQRRLRQHRHLQRRRRLPAAADRRRLRPAASCTGTTYQPPSFCSGTGTCSQTSDHELRHLRLRRATPAGPTAPPTADCASASIYCTGTEQAGAASPRRRTAPRCGADNECASGNCTDGVCCRPAAARPARRAT